MLFALPAAERAASVGAHREAAAQYARVLKFGVALKLDERAEIWERRSHECYLTDKSDEAIAAIEEALKCYRELGDKRCEGDAPVGSQRCSGAPDGPRSPRRQRQRPFRC